MYKGKWERFRSYSYTTSIAQGPSKAQMLAPANSTTLPSANVTFAWSAGYGVQKYTLWVGSAMGTSDLYRADEGINTSRTLSVPTDGRPIFVRLWTTFSAASQQYNDYTYTSPIAAGPKARLTSPLNGCTLPAATTTFTWGAGTGAQQYSLWIGSSPGAKDIYGASQGLGTSRTITLPADGRPLYVRLWTMFNGKWEQYNNYRFTASTPASQVRARLVTPANTGPLPTGPTLFAWDAGAGVQKYALWVGSTPDGYDISCSDEGTNRSKTLSLPADGRPVYVRLWSMFNGVWKTFHSYTYVTSKAPARAKAQMLAPANLSALTSSSVTFSWNAGSQAEQYRLWVGSSPGASDIYSGSEALRISKTLMLPTDGRTIHVRLWTMFGGVWTEFNNYSYTTKSP
jgi:hypothetical protein